MNCYDVLDIESDATENDIKKAYRTLSKKLHPDSGGSHEEFIQLGNAKDILLNLTERRMHDEKHRRVDGTIETRRDRIRADIERIVSSRVRTRNRIDKLREDLRDIRVKKAEFTKPETEFGEIGISVKRLCEELERRTESHKGNHAKIQCLNNSVPNRFYINYLLNESKRVGQKIKNEITDDSIDWMFHNMIKQFKFGKHFMIDEYVRDKINKKYYG